MYFYVQIKGKKCQPTGNPFLLILDKTEQQWNISSQCVNHSFNGFYKFL